MINNRQAGRRRGRGGQQQRSSGGGNPGRPDNGNRIDNRARGNAAQLLEKYKTLARDAQMQGDRVNVEYYLQFADHYFRVLAETRSRFEENGGQSTGRRPQGATLDDDDQDYEDEGERGGPNDQQRAPEQGQRDREDRDDRNGRGQNSNGYANGAGNGQRESYAAQRDQREGQRDGQRDAPRDAREDRQRGRVNGEAEYRDVETRVAPQDRDDYAPVEREEREEPRAPAPMQQDEIAQPMADGASVGEAERPRRGRGRPRRDAAAPVLAEAAPLDVRDDAEDRLPAMSLPPALNLSVSPMADEDGETAVEEKPRRRRGRPPASAAPVE